MLRRLHLPLLLLALAACSTALRPTPEPTTLRIAGSTSMGPALRELGKAYQADHPSVFVDVQGGGSAVGINLLQAGAVDLAAVSWQAPDARLPDGLRSIPVGRDAIAIIVHPGNRIPGLTLLQIRGLYRGETLNWADLGGLAEEPVVISREEGSGTRTAFEQLVMGGERVTLNALVMPTSQSVVDYVAAHRAAVGYVSMAWLTDRVRALPVEDLAPTGATVRSGYHLSRVLYLYLPDPAPPAAQSFADYVQSPAGQAILSRYHVPLR